jgi:hypothetical protein
MESFFKEHPKSKDGSTSNSLAVARSCGLIIMHRLKNFAQGGERLAGVGGGTNEVATWNKAARLLVMMMMFT